MIETLSPLDLRLQRALALPQPDRSPIYEWAAQNIELPEGYAIAGPYNADLSPWSKPIFDALKDDRVRVVTFIKCIQDAGGTLIADVWIPWLICNQPGPISFTMHTDEMVSLHAKMRLMPLLERGCEKVAAILPRPGPMRTTTEIHFGGFSLVLNSANLSDQQSQSIRFKINDEIWHPRWQSVYNDAVGRVSAFERVGTSKVFNISQGGFEGDISDKTFREGNQAEWSAPCRKCGHVHPLAFTIEREGVEGPAGGVIWDQKAKREDGVWDVSKAIATARFRCPECGDEAPDNDTTREYWRKHGRFVAMRSDAPPSNLSFHVEAVVARPMRLLVEEFLNARNELKLNGNEEPLVKFRQKREAKSWKVARTAINLFSAQADAYSVADYWEGKPVPSEVFRGATIDRQQDHFWLEIGAASVGPEYWHLFFGRVDTVEQIAQLLQRYNVPSQCVVQDRRHMPALVDADCLRFGWRGMEGFPRKTWTLEDEETGQMHNFPHSDPRIANVHGHQVPYYQFSSDHMKDIFFNCIGGKGFRWRLPKDVSPAYLEHLKGEVKQPDGRWKEVKSNAPNHGIDTSAMMVAMMTIARVVRAKTT